MTSKEYERLAKAHRLRGEKTIAACRVVLVDGLSAYAAARKVGIEESTISRALAKLRRPLCPHCGQPLRKHKDGSSLISCAEMTVSQPLTRPAS
jgi:hypothetical protein